MATNHTPNYSLSQWEAGDQFSRGDFNSDFAKIDAALGDLPLLRESVFSLAYYAGLEAIRNQILKAFTPDQFPILTCAFHPSDPVATAGGVTVANNLATLSGKGATGSVTINRSSWDSNSPKAKEARLWVHTKDGTVTPYLNGMEMRKLHSLFVTSPSISGSLCYVYSLDTSFQTSVQLKLVLDCGSYDSMTIGDIILAQF